MDIRRIGVVGSGAMGSGIAQAAATAGFAVLLRDIESGRLAQAMALITAGLDHGVQKGRLQAAERDEILQRIETTTDLDGFATSDLVIEAIWEDLSAKQELFRTLDSICRPEVILASNTSSMSITAIAASTKRPVQVCGMHFFNPVPVMRLVEVIRGHQTGDETIAVARAVAEQMGKTVVEARRDTPGFIVNRVLLPMMIEAIRLVEEGVATPEEVDLAIKLGLNHPMGPFELLDFTGIDVCHNVAEYFWQEFRQPNYAPPHLLKNLVRAGHLGRKVGRGFYDHRPPGS